MIDYHQFIDNKSQERTTEGFVPLYMPSFLFDFQIDIVEWSVRHGKSAIFADCGLGKTPMQLVWAENVIRHTNKPVLILTPLAVSAQTIRESEKFGIEAHRSFNGQGPNGVIVTNYEKLHYFDWSMFGGVVCDESSILKSFDGARRQEITEFMRRIPYRLLCTATAAPNDYIELGTSSEALGNMGHTDMLTRFFVNDQRTVKPTQYLHRGKNFQKVYESNSWRFKGHAELSFWRWVCSWARAMRKPSDLGFDNGPFQLPPLNESETIIKARIPRPDMLFDVMAIGLREEREVRRRTLNERCEAAAEHATKVNGSCVLWCHLNDEADMLENIIPGALQISGSQSDELKEERFEAFRTGELKTLVIKPKIGAFGLNWQHCSDIVYFTSHSYEQYYQAVRRCWRFGQTNPVNVNIILSEGEERILENLRRKSNAASIMFNNLVREMNHAITIDHSREFTERMEIPKWL